MLARKDGRLAPRRTTWMTTPRRLMVLWFLVAGALVLWAGCSEDEECASCPQPSIRLDRIQAIPESTSVGDSLHLWGIGQGGGLTFQWTATHGRFIVTDENYARWKAPDSPAIVTITLVVFNETESATVSLTVPIDTYAPRHTPAYAPASFCGLECHGVEGHGSHYDTWVATAHADAFEGVTSSAAFTDACLDCHTVGAADRNEQGWPLHNGGYDEVPIADLAGVQCASCHGPLADAVGDTIADHGTLGSGDFLLAVGTILEPTGCARCHEAPQHDKLLLSQWAASDHAGSDEADGVAGQAACARCHTAQGFIAYTTTGSSVAPDAPLPITCAACHDPHAATHPADLRVGYSREDDICRRCHNDEGHAELETPHAPQAQMLAGTGGYEYDLTEAPSSPHLNVAAKGCVSCHYASDPDERPHRFRRDLASCLACHPEANANSLTWSAGRTEIIGLLSQLEDELERATAADSATTAFQQANYNWHFVDADGSRGTHNHAYAKALLETSLAEFEPSR